MRLAKDERACGLAAASAEACRRLLACDSVIRGPVRIGSRRGSLLPMMHAD